MSPIKYFDSQVFTAESELSCAEAAAREYYVAAYCPAGGGQAHPERAELVHRAAGETEIHRVVYYDRPLPHDEVVRQHLQAYPGTPAEVVLPLAVAQGTTLRTSYRYDGNGELRHVQEAHTSERPQRVLEVHKDARGNVIGTLEFEYDGEDRLSVVRERRADGTLISEDFVAD